MTGVTAVPTLLGALLLSSALPFYAVGWILGKVRQAGPDRGQANWTSGWSRLAPWLSVFAGLVLLVFLVVLGTAISATLSTDQNLIGLCAISSSWRWPFYLPPLVILFVAGMVVAALAIWVGHHRLLVGRIYYTVLTLCGLSTVSNLFTLGVVGLWR
jgi:hypothetical protein